MRIASIAAGAAGMYCGTCIHDNTLAAALIRKGHQVALVPTYTPLRTDETDVSIDRIFYGGINVYLQQKIGIFRHTPRILDSLLNRPSLLNMLSRFSGSTDARDLGKLTVSVLNGEQGHQRKELFKLIDWLKNEYKPEIIQLTNSMFLGMAREIKKAMGVPLLCALQGEDIFLQDLQEPYMSEVLKILRERARDVDGYIAPGRYYADFMADLLQVPPQMVNVVPLGISMKNIGDQRKERRDPFTVGYLARICPEKGLHVLVDAFRILREKYGAGKVELRVAGYLGKRDEMYFRKLTTQIDIEGWTDSFHYAGEVDREQKMKFLSGLDVFSVPAEYRESKGLSILEAMASGVPVVQPRHGSYPELIERTQGGLLVEPDSATALAEALDRLKNDPALAAQMGRMGKEATHRLYNDDVMADATLAVYRKYIS